MTSPPQPHSLGLDPVLVCRHPNQEGIKQQGWHVALHPSADCLISIGYEDGQLALVINTADRGEGPDHRRLESWNISEHQILLLVDALLRLVCDLPTKNPARPPIGTVLTADSPQPPNGTPLLDYDGVTELYDDTDTDGSWSEWVRRFGPFVVGLDYLAIVPTKDGETVWT